MIAAATQVFLTTGFQGTSIDDLVTATGVHRGSLYQAFGSKLGIFLAGLRQVVAAPIDGHGLDLLLVATLELAPRDAQVRALVAGALHEHPDPARLLGARLLQRALIDLTEGSSS